MTAYWTDDLVRLEACPAAVDWARQFATPPEAWQACDRAEWMLWAIGHTDTSAPYSPERRRLVACACELARMAWEWMPEPARECLALHERWASGEEVPESELRAAASTAFADYAAEAAYPDYAAYAARAAYAAFAAYAASAAYPDYAAADVARAYIYVVAAAYVVDAVSAADACSIIRRHYPIPPRITP